MRVVFVALLCAMVAAVGIYFYFYIHRAVIWLAGRRKKPSGMSGRLIAVAGAVLAAASTLNMWSVQVIVVLHLMGFALCLDAVYFLVRRFGRPRARLEALYRCGLIPVLCTACMIGYGYLNMHRVVRTDYRVETEKNIRGEGYRVALLSDLHAGTSMDTETLRGYMEEIQAASPDLVVLCGDMVDESTTWEEMEETMAVLGSIESPLGVYFVHGNHDKTRYSRNRYFTAQELETAIRSAGIRILADEAVELTKDFTVIGRDDRSFPRDGRRETIGELLRSVDRENFLLLLDHQPCELAEADRQGADLLLSGHTHAGQIWPTGLISEGTGIVEMNYGYRKLERLQVIVTSGIAGWGYPIRTSRHCEYVIIDIERE